MLFDYFTGIIRTTGGKSASRWNKRTNQVLITSYQRNYKSAHLISSWWNSFFKLSNGASAEGEYLRLTITTRSNPYCLMLCWRNTSRIIRLTRFRFTAEGSVFLLVIIPRRACFPWLGVKNILNCSSVMFLAWMTCSKPSARSNLHAALNLPSLLDCESCTTFGATRPDYSTSSACFHAYQKAMGALSFNNGWLVGAFHVDYSSVIS